MAETLLPVVPGKEALTKKTEKKIAKVVGISAADKFIESSGFKSLKAIKLRARAKVGGFIEQEGEHHISRAAFAYTFAELEGYKQECEEYLAKAKEKGDDKEIEKWMRLTVIVLEQMNKAAKNLNQTRRMPDKDNEPSAFRVPTMPARTVITNNTQIVVQPSKTE